MKNKSMIVAALMIVSTAVVFAGKDEPNNNGLAIVPVKGSQVFKVVYKSETATKVKLTVRDESGAVVFYESLGGSNGFIRPLNFTGLPAGVYTIEINDGNGKKIEKVSYQPKGSIRQVHVSKLSGDGAKYLLAIANSGDQDIAINIIDSENKVVYTEIRTIKGDFAQVYKLDGHSTAYTFEVVDSTGNTKSIKF